jgi:hypothetical protein
MLWQENFVGFTSTRKSRMWIVGKLPCRNFPYACPNVETMEDAIEKPAIGMYQPLA